jgi:hypothetical protein
VFGENASFGLPCAGRLEKVHEDENLFDLARLLKDNEPGIAHSKGNTSYILE